MSRYNPQGASGDLFAPAPAAISSRQQGKTAALERAVADQAAGIQRGIDGAQAALDHADGVTTVGTDSWSDQAWAFTRRWIRGAHPSVEFALEEVRLDFEEAGNPVPPNNNAWGAIGRRIIREKLAKRTGSYRPARIASSNGRAVALYRRAPL